MFMPMIQFSSRGRRKPPVKKTRHMWTTMAPTKMFADQWCIWRMSSPARTLKLRLTVERYASDMCTPSSGRYGPL